jgi:transposase-like protein
MSVEATYYPITCPECGSDNTDCSINFGSDRVDGQDAWDEVWKCRDCGARFPVARLFTAEDYEQKVEMLLDDLLGIERPTWEDVQDFARTIVAEFPGIQK